MYGLPVDTDVSFLRGSSLLRVCVGENETILSLLSRISIMIASSVSIVPRGGAESTFEEPRQLGPSNTYTCPRNSDPRHPISD
jgi:hypothetical protein